MANVITGFRIVCALALIIPACIMTTIAAIQEGCFIRKGKQVD